MATQSDDRYAAWRAELRRCRLAAKLTHTAAAQRAGITGAWWGYLERGRDGRGVPANPSRDAIIHTADAVGMDVDRALGMAGESPMTPTEAARLTNDPRAELTDLLPGLSRARVEALLYVARTMKDPNAAMEIRGSGDPPGQQISRVIEGPREPHGSELDSAQPDDEVNRGQQPG